MSLEHLPQVLECARAEEARTGHLDARLRQTLAGLPLLCDHDEASRLASLRHFTLQYIAHAPRLAQALRATARASGLEALVAPLLARLLAAYRLAEGEGLDSLLARAYVVQRMVEEVNDRFMVMAGAPLLALDMTTANLVVHQIIGEPFANALDDEAVAAAARIVSRHVQHPAQLFAATEAHRLRMWTTAWTHWSEELALGAPVVGTRMR
ncbi:MAG: hypothetical protein ACK4UT_02825 [Moraxellaceae bacterium]